MEYYSTIKKNEVVTPATTWVNLEDIKCIIPFTRWSRQIHREKVDLWLPRTGGREK